MYFKSILITWVQLFVLAIVRDNTLGIEFLKKYKGLVLLNKAMESGNEKVVIKVSYLISALCDTDSSVKGKWFQHQSFPLELKE